MKRTLRLRESEAADFGFSPKLPANEADAQERLLEARGLRQKYGQNAQRLVNFAERNLRAFQSGTDSTLR